MHLNTAPVDDIPSASCANPSASPWLLSSHTLSSWRGSREGGGSPRVRHQNQLEGRSHSEVCTSQTVCVNNRYLVATHGGSFCRCVANVANVSPATNTVPLCPFLLSWGQWPAFGQRCQSMLHAPPPSDLLSLESLPARGTPFSKALALLVAVLLLLLFPPPRVIPRPPFKSLQLSCTRTFGHDLSPTFFETPPVTPGEELGALLSMSSALEDALRSFDPSNCKCNSFAIVNH